ncbi:MAG: hypothetical protein HOK72_02075 [Flavobacteriales bacterium]|nr:hypothetical protein [Flavobacteriales bacterium]
MEIYNFIKENLKSLTNHTSMLEACDWDDKLLEENLEFFSDYMNNVYFPSSFTWEMIVESIKTSLKNRIEIKLVEIFIRVLESEKESIIKQMGLEEN